MTSYLRSLDRRSLLGLATLVVGTVLVVLGLGGTLRGLFENPDTRTARAVFRSAQQLRAGNPVRIDGVEAGTVKDIALDSDGARAIVTMDMDESSGDLYSDARATVRWRTVLGGSFYVDLERGTPAAGALKPAGIPIERTKSQVELDEVTSVIEGRARKGLQTLPGELATALRDPADPKRLLKEVAGVSPDATIALRALRGRVPERDLRALVANTARTMEALDRPREELRAVVAGAGATLATTANRRAEIRSTISRAPAVMRNTEVTLQRLTATLDGVDPLLARLRAPAGEVAATVARLRPTVVEAADLLDRARPLLRALRPAASSLQRAAEAGLPLLTGLEPSLDRLDDAILPMLSEKDPATTKSTAVMIGGTFAGLASGAGGQMDALGHFIRFPATAGNSSVYSLPCQSYLANPDKDELVACQTLEQAMKTYLTYRPLGPTPGTDPGGTRRRSR
jgi:virulence factor Mce-like protein